MISTDISPETRAIANILREVPRGGRVTLKQMSEVIGRSIADHRYILYSAMHIVERDDGIVFACERGKGYRRLVPDEIHNIGKTTRDRVRHMSRRGYRSINAGVVGANDISEDAKRNALREVSALAMIEHMSRDRNLPDVEKGDSVPLPVAKAAHEFLKKIGALPIRDAPKEGEESTS